MKPSAHSPLSEPAPMAGLSGPLATLDQAEKLLQQALDENDAAAASRLEKLIIQVPCFNEAETLGVTLAELPRQVPGVRCVEWLVIDDGSTDGTVDVARAHGVDHILKLTRNQGLARAFTAGIEEAVRLGADVIVNTDADNQYCAADIGRLVGPIVSGEADLVIGERPIMSTPHFSLAKKLLQRLGSWVVRQASSARVTDAPSGFRAMTRKTAMRLNVFTDYTYTLETIIQAGQNNMAVVSVPVRTNPDLRPSRLLKSIPVYIRRSAMTIVRIFMAYRPLEFFAIPGLLSCLAGGALWVRFGFFWMTQGGSGHVQSLILGSLLLGAGMASIVVGLVADLISVNRKLLEKVDWHVRQLQEQINRPGGPAARPDDQVASEGMVEG